MVKKELWGSRRKLNDKQLGELERIYAHFHRVLGPLLVELAELPGTVWLDEARAHVLTGEGEDNVYARAIYPVTDLAPYRERLAELAKVQAAGTELLGGGGESQGPAATQGRRGRPPRAHQPAPQLRHQSPQPTRRPRASRRNARHHPRQPPPVRSLRQHP